MNYFEKKESCQSVAIGQQSAGTFSRESSSRHQRSCSQLTRRTEIMQPINPQDRDHIANQHTGQRPCSQSTHRTEIM